MGRSSPADQRAGEVHFERTQRCGVFGEGRGISKAHVETQGREMQEVTTRQASSARLGTLPSTCTSEGPQEALRRPGGGAGSPGHHYVMGLGPDLWGEVKPGPSQGHGGGGGGYSKG